MAYISLSIHDFQQSKSSSTNVFEPGSTPSSANTKVDNNDSKFDQYHQPDDEEFEGHWDLSYDTDVKKNTLAVSLGAGSQLYGNDLGVDIRIGCPANSTESVVPIHAILRTNPSSGFLTIEGVENDYPVGYIRDDETVSLGAGKRHSLWQKANRFFLGNLEFELKYAKLDKARLHKLRALRDKAFFNNGLRAPNAHLPVLPPSLDKLDQQGDFLLFGILGEGSYGLVRIGINITTGDICAVKSVHVKNPAVLEEILNEANILFKFPVCSRSLHLIDYDMY